jgi:hypothetical protein
MPAIELRRPIRMTSTESLAPLHEHHVNAHHRTKENPKRSQRAQTLDSRRAPRSNKDSARPLHRIFPAGATEDLPTRQRKESGRDEQYGLEQGRASSLQTASSRPSIYLPAKRAVQRMPEKRFGHWIESQYIVWSVAYRARPRSLSHSFPLQRLAFASAK